MNIMRFCIRFFCVPLVAFAQNKTSNDALKISVEDERVTLTPKAARHASRVLAEEAHRQARMLLADGKVHDYWQKLCQAVSFDSTHKVILPEFLEVWRQFLETEILYVGQLEEQALLALGDGEKHKQKEGISHRYYAFMRVDFLDGRLVRIVDLRNVDPQMLHLTETLTYPHAFTGFKVFARSLNQFFEEELFTRNGQAPSKTKEQVQVRRFYGNGNLAERQRELVERAKRDATDNKTQPGTFQVVESTDNRTIVEITYKTRNQLPSHTEITCFLSGQRDVYVIRWQMEAPEIIDEGREYWFNAMRQLNLKPIQH